ncbi:type 1 fimbria pilin [Pseudomonas nitritireducens]|uniref:Type 1 fimbria pilin n=1 Tax=Pseudomonas nitroreducens TaxID=46680 RepID=A0A7W7KJN1_PSENT|nr:fimbrial protein [Pseudomonas nitritireducens]MBB4864070.1 type 1 fimbria pilin [Pseudomonas nitritireducens]
MKAFKLLLLTSAMTALAGNALAADGTINFTGEIIAASCKVGANTGAVVGGDVGHQTVDVKLGKVSADSISGTAGGGIAAGTNISLSLDCGATGKDLSNVKLAFDPASGSGLDLKNNSLLKVTGGAGGVGIGLYNDQNQLINLAANEGYTGEIVKEADDSYKATLNLRAGYVANGDTIVPGAANGTLPFTLSYE